MEKGSKNALTAGIIALLIVGGVTAVVLGNNSNDSEETPTTSQNSETENQDEAAEPTQNIVELASATEDLSTLVTAVTAAELGSVLSDETMEYTVFAPTNAAFAALPEGTLDTLLEPANQEQLQGVLTYHVVEGSVLSSDLSDGQVVTTVNGQTLTVDITDEGVFIVDQNDGRAQVTTADVRANNGVVHIINAVVLPQ